jgi:hypothetical protein
MIVEINAAFLLRFFTQGIVSAFAAATLLVSGLFFRRFLLVSKNGRFLGCLTR